MMYIWKLISLSELVKLSTTKQPSRDEQQQFNGVRANYVKSRKLFFRAVGLQQK